MSTPITLFTAIVGSTAVASLIQFFVTRNDDQRALIQDLIKALNRLQDVFDQYRAKCARRDILVASDDVRYGTRHSKEWWNQVLEDITEYNQYCDAHPEFKNNKAVHAIAHLDTTYAKILAKNDFLV